MDKKSLCHRANVAVVCNSDSDVPPEEVEYYNACTVCWAPCKAYWITPAIPSFKNKIGGDPADGPALFEKKPITPDVYIERFGYGMSTEGFNLIQIERIKSFVDHIIELTREDQRKKDLVRTKEELTKYANSLGWDVAFNIAKNKILKG